MHRTEMVPNSASVDLIRPKGPPVESPKAAQQHTPREDGVSARPAGRERKKEGRGGEERKIFKKKKYCPLPELN